MRTGKVDGPVVVMLVSLALATIVAMSIVVAAIVDRSSPKAFLVRGAGYTPHGTFVGVSETEQGVFEVTVCTETVVGVRTCEVADIHTISKASDK